MPITDHQAKYYAHELTIRHAAGGGESYALPRNQRHLTGLILRKLLASSSHAVLNTLQTILKWLQALRDDQRASFYIVATLVDEGDQEQDCLKEIDDHLTTLLRKTGGLDFRSV